MKPHYHHTQVGWVILIAVLGLGGSSAGALLFVEMAVAALLVGAGTILLCALFGTLTVSVTSQHLVARFGLGLIRKTIDLAKVRAYAPVRTPWYYGWGIRIYPGGVLYNVGGLDSVEFTLDGGKRCRIGTDEPAALHAAVRKAIGELPPLSEAAQRQGRKRARRFAIGIIVSLLLLFLGVGGLMTLQHREPTVTVESDALVIDSVFYGDRYTMADIDSVTLETSLPRIRVRTNGYALGGKLRGHFALDRLGGCKLFIDVTVPPFVVVRTRGTYVVFNQEDPSRTRLLFDELVRTRNASHRP